MPSNMKSAVFLFLFIIASVVAAKWIGQKIPAVGKVTNTI